MGLLASHIGGRVRASAKEAGLGEGFTRHLKRVGSPRFGGQWSGAASARDRRSMEELQDAREVHRAPGSGPGSGEQMLPVKLRQTFPCSLMVGGG